jgi:hypothetical protein
MPSKIRAKSLQKSQKSSQKIKKVLKRRQKLKKSPKLETNAVPARPLPSKRGKQPSASGLCKKCASPIPKKKLKLGKEIAPCKKCAGPVPKKRLRPGLVLDTCTKRANQNPNKKQAAGPVLDTCTKRAGPVPNKRLRPGPILAKKKSTGIKLAPCKNHASPKLGTNLASARAAYRKAPKTSQEAPKKVTSQSEASQNGAQIPLPSIENQGVGAVGGPRTRVSKAQGTLASLALKPNLKPGTKLAKKREPKLGTREFKDLQALWYAKLAKTGFQDLEPDNNQDGLLSARGSQSQAKFSTVALQFRELYYRRISNFITHNPKWHAKALYNLVGLLYSEGLSYRKMLPVIKRRIKKSTNIWRVHKIVKLFEVRVLAWNKLSPEGIDFEPDIEPTMVMPPLDKV